MIVRVTGQDVLARTVGALCANHFHSEGDPDVLWICYDTPLGEKPDVDWVMTQIAKDIEAVTPRTLILVSSQIVVGTIAALELAHPTFRFAYTPENIRVKFAMQDFASQARIVVGRRTTQDDGLLRELFAPFTQHVILTDPETAEMVKHALNCYLGLSIAYINEIARLAKLVGADIDTIATALLTERRISPNAPLKAGPPFGEGHLARDIGMMTALAAEHGIVIPIIDAIMGSNSVAQFWSPLQ